MTDEPVPEHPPNSIEDAEREARQIMQDKLAEHLKLTLFAINTMAFVIGSVPPTPLTKLKTSFKVVTLLLNRISNDIRTAALLSWHGYALQSAALIADCHESAFSVLYVGSDNDVAQGWINHNDPTVTPFGKVKDLIRKGLENLKVPDVKGQARREYITYRQLCWAKHGNPILQKWHGVRSQGNQIGVSNGPDTSEESIRVAAYALEHAAHLGYLALVSFVTNHLPHSPILTQLNQQIEALGAAKSKIAEASLIRWGDTDPFPGKWKT